MSESNKPGLIEIYTRWATGKDTGQAVPDAAHDAAYDHETGDMGISRDLFHLYALGPNASNFDQCARVVKDWAYGVAIDHVSRSRKRKCYPLSWVKQAARDGLCAALFGFKPPIREDCPISAPTYIALRRSVEIAAAAEVDEFSYKFERHL